jgi:uncharacterized membrane protein (UPF0127 family)
MEIYYLPKDERLRWMKTCKPVLDAVVEKTGDRGRKMLELAEKYGTDSYHVHPYLREDAARWIVEKK